jgi:hypothetical protein
MLNQIWMLILSEEQIVGNVSMYMINKILLLKYSYWWMGKIKLYNRDNKCKIILILIHNNHDKKYKYDVYRVLLKILNNIFFKNH